jgi:hypothetical protein
MYKNEIIINRKDRNYRIYNNLYSIKEEEEYELHRENIEDDLFVYIISIFCDIPNKVCNYLSTCIKSNEELFN